MAKVLVIGGAGYVGSATVAHLMDRGHDVTVYDDLSTGLRELVLSPAFVYARAGDATTLADTLAQGRFDCVMHFAARSLVSESIKRPAEYFENNVAQTQIVLEAMRAAGIRNFVFSSSCAIFGHVGEQVIDEKLPKIPTTPYGENKLAVEQMLSRLAQEFGLRSVSLRYFNAAGTEPKQRVGELHEPELHLIPNVLRAAYDGTEVQIFGNQYPTPDGTCIRDYVHVSDLAQAHEAAMEKLLRFDSKSLKGEAFAYNLGSDHGFSVLEIVKAAERVTQKKIRIRISDPRPGDPPRLVACSALAKAELGFVPQQSSIETILQSAWEWTKKSRVNGRAVFLDRDGTVNHDPGYLSHPDQFDLMPGVGPALKSLKDAGYKLILVSNQSGVGRGLIEKDNLFKIHTKLDQLLSQYQVSIDHIELCIHHPQEDCDCRKPKPKLILDAAKKMRVDVSQSFMVGDKATDVGAGLAAQCQGVALVLTGEGMQDQSKIDTQAGVFIAQDLAAAAKWILAARQP